MSWIEEFRFIGSVLNMPGRFTGKMMRGHARYMSGGDPIKANSLMSLFWNMQRQGMIIDLGPNGYTVNDRMFVD